MGVAQAKLQIEAMEGDLRKNQIYRDDLERIIDAYNAPTMPLIETPFQFFFDLYKE